MTLSSPPSAHSLRDMLLRAPLVFALLLAFTVTMLVWQHYGMERVYEVSATSGHHFYGAGDGDVGGASTATLTRQGDSLHMKCTLVAKFRWPYCKLLFTLATGTEGVDLSSYQRMELVAAAHGAGPRVRINLVDFEEGLSIPKMWQTHKIIAVDPFDLPASGRITLPFDLLHPATWWKDQAKPPLMRSNVRIDNVTHVELQTASGIPLGDYALSFRALRFYGKVISRADLLLALVGLWMLCAMAWPLAMYILLKSDVDQGQAQARLLGEVNRALGLDGGEPAGQVHVDALTGALNRHGLRTQLLQSPLLLGPPMSLIIIDVDHLAAINGSRGQEDGDLVLRQLASTVAALIRSNDKLVRWHGDSFLLLCPMTDFMQAAALAEKLRVAVQYAAWPEGLAVTASFGAAQHVPGEELGRLIERADVELRSAMACGCNRVHAYGLPRRAAA